jgi:hypothetical protein
MEQTAIITRKDGRWVIDLELERWVIEDIANDQSRIKPELLLLNITEDRNQYTTGGSTKFSSMTGMYEPPPPPLEIYGDVEFILPIDQEPFNKTSK